MRYFLLLLALSVAAVVGILGFRGSHFRKPPLYIFPDMEWQLNLRPQHPNGFFTNGSSSQLPVPGTIPRSAPIQTTAGPVYPYEDARVNSGMVSGTTNFVEVNPLPVTAGLLKRGQQRFTINCAPCHGQLGDGNGVPKKIGAMPVVANLHDKRIVSMGDGELFLFSGESADARPQALPSNTPSSTATLCRGCATPTSWIKARGRNLRPVPK